MARKITVQIVGDATQLERSFKRAGDASDGFSKRLGGSRRMIAKLGLAGAAAGGIAVITKQLFASVNAAKEAEAAQVRLGTALKNAGVSQKRYGKQIDDSIQKTSKLAGIDDEGLSDVFANLVRTTGSVQKATKGMALAANIARARNISLAAAGKIVEKAHTGQLRGLKAVGVQIGKNTTATEAIERAQRKFAGSAEAYGRTAAGAQDKLSVAFENLQEKVGAKVLPVLTKLSLKLVDLIDWSEKNWPRFSAAIQRAWKKAKPAIDLVKENVRNVVTVIKGVVNIIRGIIDGDWARVWDGMKKVVSGVVGNVVLTFVKMPGLILSKLSSAAFRGLSKIGTWIKDAAISGLKGIADGVLKALTSAFNGVIALVNKAIKVYNRIPIAPNLPEIPKIGGNPKPSRNATPLVTGERGGPSVSRGDGISINTVVLNGVQNPQQFLRELQRAAGSTTAPRRGRFSGANLGLS